MKCLACLLVPVFVLWTPLQGGAVESDGASTGLWHVHDESARTTYCYLYNDGENWKVFSPDWIPIDSPVREESGSVEFVVPSGTYKSNFRGTLVDSVLQGTWDREHVQFEIKGEWVGDRIFIRESWDPWGFTEHLKEDVADLSGRLATAGPFDDFAAFLQHWQEEIEPDFYVVLSRLIYTDPDGIQSPQTRLAGLESIFRAIQEDPEAFRAASARLNQQLGEVRKDVQERFSWFQRPPIIITVPSGGRFDYRVLRLGKPSRHLLLLATDSYQKESIPERQKIFLAEGLAYSTVRERYSYPTIIMEIVARGLASVLTEELGYARDLSDLLLLKHSSPGELEAGFEEFRLRLAGTRSVRLQPNFAGYFLGKELEESSYFGYRFAKDLASRGPLEELVRIMPSLMVEAIQTFLRKPPSPAGHTRPDPDDSGSN